MEINGDVQISGLGDLHNHLDALLSDAELAVNATLVEHVNLQLNKANVAPLVPSLLPKVANILKTYNKPDIMPIYELVVKLLGPLDYGTCLQFATTDDLILALRSPDKGPNLLATAILDKAASPHQDNTARSHDDVARLVGDKELLKALLSAWLVSPSAAVGEECCKVLSDLLARDEVVGMAIFEDQEVYRTILSHASGETEECSTLQQKTTAQGRVFGLILALARDLRFLIEPGVDGLPALLPWAAFSMVDKEDELMMRNLREFWQDLVLRTTEARGGSSTGVAEVMKGLISRACNDDPVLRQHIVFLPQSVQDEAESNAVEAWVQEIMPGATLPVNRSRVNGADASHTPTDTSSPADVQGQLRQNPHSTTMNTVNNHSANIAYNRNTLTKSPRFHHVTPVAQASAAAAFTTTMPVPSGPELQTLPNLAHGNTQTLLDNTLRLVEGTGSGITALGNHIGPLSPPGRISMLGDEVFGTAPSINRTG